MKAIARRNRPRKQRNLSARLVRAEGGWAREGERRGVLDVAAGDRRFIEASDGRIPLGAERAKTHELRVRGMIEGTRNLRRLARRAADRRLGIGQPAVTQGSDLTAVAGFGDEEIGRAHV